MGGSPIPLWVGGMLYYLQSAKALDTAVATALEEVALAPEIAVLLENKPTNFHGIKREEKS